jgi:hypothetical protein
MIKITINIIDDDTKLLLKLRMESKVGRDLKG